jgi:flagellar hook protein FlgE
MIQAMLSAVSGVQAHQTRLDVVGNNIANVNTVGYKAARTTFVDQLSQSYRGANPPKDGRGGVNPTQVGQGVRLGSITTMQTQGALQQTGRPSDIAIQGNGFFLVGDGQTPSYTRDGAFTLDQEGSLVSATTGLKLLGWQAVNGQVDAAAPVTAASSIRIPIGTMTSVRETSTVDFAGNLDARAAIGGSAYTRTAQAFDSLGNPHTIAFRFERVAAAAPAAATWQYTTSIDGGAYSTAGGTNSGVVNFDEAGKLTGSTGTVALSPGAGAADFTVTPSFAELSQLSGEYTANAISQDGFPFGVLQSYAIADDGTVSGIFSNGQSQELGRIAVAQFTNPAGLDKAGSNLFRPTTNSGTPQVSGPGSAGAGRVSAGFLEQSNVNLADEFTGMIITQRGFQANTRVVSASDEILQDLIQMKR